MNKFALIVLGLMALLIGANFYDGSITPPWEDPGTGYLNGPSEASGGNASGLLALFALLPGFLKFGLIFAAVGLLFAVVVIMDAVIGRHYRGLGKWL